MTPRELPLVLVSCCSVYAVSELHPVPKCDRCDETPTYVGDTTWYLWLEENAD